MTLDHIPLWLLPQLDAATFREIGRTKHLLERFSEPVKRESWKSIKAAKKAARARRK